MDPSVQKIINAAKRHAIAADAQVLGFDEVLVALAALRDDKTVAECVAKALGVKTVKWPPELLERAAVAVGVDDQQVQARQFALEPRFKDVFNGLRRAGATVKLETFLGAVLLAPEARECPAVQEFLDSHQMHSKKKKRVGLLGKLDEVERRRSKLEALLAEKVIGQDEAIRALGQGYLYSLREPREQGLRGIFTFLGPPGVGKTMLAEEFARALNEVEKGAGGQAYEAHTFAMNASDDEGMKFQLFGTSSHFSGGKPGILHDLINGNEGAKIKANLRQVFVFDELEKAGEKTIQSMLTLLSKGGFNDNFQQAFVDASQCFVIFTTNLGQEFFSSANQSGLLRGARFSSDQIFDLLATAKRRTQVNTDEAPPALSPEFVDRLRQGAAVLFNRLSIGDYARITDAIFAADVGGKQLLPRVVVSEEAKRLLILSLLPDLSARSLINQARRLKHRWTDEVLRLELPELQNQRSEHFTIDVTQKLDTASSELLNKLVTSKPVKVLVVDNDERMARFVEDYVTSPDRQIKVEARRIKPGEAVEEILKSRPDLVLLDLDLPADQLPGGEIKVLHRQIRETTPTVRLWLFSEERGGDSDFSELVEQGGARGYFSFQKDAQDVVLSEDHQARFQQVLEEVVFDRVMFELERSRRRLSPDFTFRDCKADDAEPTVAVEITLLRSEQNVSLVTSSGQIAPGEKPEVTFDDVFGLERAKERLRDAIGMLKDPGRLSKFGVKAPCGYLLAGPPGTGKTHLARAVANAADCVFFPVSCGELESKWIGETEERIRQLFQDARKYAPAVIFIDEIDAIAGNRNGVSGTTHQPYVKALNQLLACMDGFAAAKGQILVLAATNRPEALDPAIKRPGRFDETIPIDVPKGAAREQMLRGLLAKKPCEPDVLGAIPRMVPRTARLSPAEIDRVIREAVYLAARDNRDKISIEDLETAANFVQYGAEKRDLTITEDDRRRTAWHEAGHAVANHLLFPEGKLDLLTIVPNEEGALGFAAYADDETRTNCSANDFRKRIIVCLAGREAERLCDGAGSDAVNTGVSSDYRQATRWAWDFVARYGFDEKFGVFSVSGVPEQIQSALADPIHARVNDLLSACLEDCRRLMEANRECLRRLADVLLDKQFIYGEEVRNIVKPHLKPVAGI